MRNPIKKRDNTSLYGLKRIKANVIETFTENGTKGLEEFMEDEE